MTVEDQANKYMKDKNTRVFVDCNYKLGYKTYAVVVDNSGGFWLNCFRTKKDADKYITDNNLIK